MGDVSEVLRGSDRWVASYDGAYVCPEHDLGQYIALISAVNASGDAERIRRARLLAAAPELLAACKAMINAYWRGSEDSDDEDAPTMVKDALAAIAKAEGRR